MLKEEKGLGKKGMELTFSAMVVIVLSILLLVAVLFMFTKASGNFKDAIANFFSSSNVDSIVDTCNRQVETLQSYEYCCVKKEVKLSSKDKRMLTCGEASEESFGSRINKMNCEGVC